MSETNSNSTLHRDIPGHNHTRKAASKPVMLQSAADVFAAADAGMIISNAPVAAPPMSPASAPLVNVQHLKGRGAGYLSGSPLYVPCKTVPSPSHENPGFFISLLVLLLGILCLAAVAACNKVKDSDKEAQPPSYIQRDAVMSTEPPSRHFDVDSSQRYDVDSSQRFNQGTFPTPSARLLYTNNEQPHYLTPVRSELSPPPSGQLGQSYSPRSGQFYSQGQLRPEEAMGTQQAREPYAQAGTSFVASTPSSRNALPPSMPLPSAMGPQGNPQSYRMQS